MTRITDSMQDILAGCSTVLDVGVGTGRFAGPLIGRGFRVVGADISLPMMLKARQKGLKDLVRGDARKLPFHNRTFDSALVVHLLHLVNDWVNIVHDVGRVAGLLIISLVGTASGFRIRREYLTLRDEIGRSAEASQQRRRGTAQASATKTDILRGRAYNNNKLRRGDSVSRTWRLRNIMGSS